MSPTWEDLHGGGVKQAKDEPAPAIKGVDLERSWWEVWNERCRADWALFDIENYAKMMGQHAVARMARRGRMGRAAVEEEDRVVAAMIEACTTVVTEEDLE